MSIRPTMTIEERAFELFPDDLFRKDFQEEIGNIYDRIENAIEFVRMPVEEFDVKIGWRTLYDISFLFKDNYVVQNEIDMAFYKKDGNKLLGGYMYIKPDPEPCLEPVENLLDEEYLIFREEKERVEVMTSECKIFLPLLPTIQTFSPKMFERNTFFVDIRELTFFLEKFRFNPIILCEAAKRFPRKGLLVVEINKAWNAPKIIYPTSAQFPKLIKFAKKLDRIIRADVSKYPDSSNNKS